MIVDGGENVCLLGLDFGSTTSSAMLARARIEASSASGRMAFGAPDILYRSPPVFTPFAGEDLDLDAIDALLGQWTMAMGMEMAGLFAGGAIVTGLAARARNAAALRALVRERVGNAVMATADDPRLESWLAFMGSVATLSRVHADRHFINLDIGGGTTNAALGRDGEVLDTACHFIGARHLQCAAGTYRVTAISDYGRAMLAALNLDVGVGTTLGDAARQVLLAAWIDGLTGIVAGRGVADTALAAAGIEQSGWTQRTPTAPIVTFSGGVGELVYRLAAGEPAPPTTQYGDLGIDLAVAILASPQLSAGVSEHVPENRGRATCYGVALHSTEVSGTTLFLPRPAALPLHDIPIIGRIEGGDPPGRLQEMLALARHCASGAALYLDLGGGGFGHAELRVLGTRLAEAIRLAGLPDELPIVILVNQNVGKALGQYATDWGRHPAPLIVIDEVPGRRAHFVNIGRLHRQVVPVSFYGLN